MWLTGSLQSLLPVDPPIERYENVYIVPGINPVITIDRAPVKTTVASPQSAEPDFLRTSYDLALRSGVPRNVSWPLVPLVILVIDCLGSGDCERFKLF